MNQKMEKEMLEKLEKKIEKLLSEWHVVGGAVSVVKDDEVIINRGFGKKEIGKDDLVDENTIFGIGSNTKSFTAAGIAKLVDEGKLNWDDRITKHLPDFKLSDPWVTEQITLRDVLCHRTGLGRAMRPLYNRNYSIDDVIHRMRYMDFVADFRDDFGYNNYHFMIAGKVIEAVTGKTWPEYMMEAFFKPLEMKSSSADRKQLGNPSNISAAHANLDDSFIPHHVRVFAEEQAVPWDDVGNQPAGGINSTATDLTHWIKMLLSGGKYNGEQILSPKVIQEMTQPAVAMKHPENTELGFLLPLEPNINFYTYGLGWFVIDYNGRKIFFHGGQITGFNSIVAFLPRENLGLSIMLNSHQTVLHAVIMFEILDALFKEQKIDWSAGLLNILQMGSKQAESHTEQMLKSRKADIPPSLDLKEYCGTYHNDFVGDTTIELVDGKLIMKYGTNFRGEVFHWEKDSFYVKWEIAHFDHLHFNFEVDDGILKGLSIQGEGFYQKQ